MDVKTYKALLCVGIILTTGLQGLAPAQSVTYSTTAPTSDVEQQITDTTGSNLQWRNVTPTSSTSNRQVGFDFTASSSFTLAAVTLDLSGVGSDAVGSTFSISILDMGNGLTSAPTSVLETDPGLTIPTGTTSPGYLTFDITNIALTSGDDYGVLLSFTGAAAATENLNFNEGNNSDPGKDIYTYDGVNYSTGAVLDYTLQSAAAPEPSTRAFVLAGLVILAFIVVWRAHRMA